MGGEVVILANSLISHFQWGLRHSAMYPFQASPATFQAAYLMATGLVRCRRFQSMAPPSWKKMHRHIQVSVDIFGQFKSEFPPLHLRIS